MWVKAQVEDGAWSNLEIPESVGSEAEDSSWNGYYFVYSALYPRSL